MKNSFLYLIILLSMITIFSCKKDNFQEPTVILSGNLLYQSDTIYLEENQVPFLVYQSGFGRVGPIGSIEGTNNPNNLPVNSITAFDQSGGYSLALYNGDYKIVIPNGQGPFMWKQTAAGNPDTVNVTLNGNQTLDLQVTPYYMIGSTQMNVTSTDSILHATCQVKKIITDVNAKDVESVTLFVSKTQFVSGTNNIASSSIAGSAITDLNNVQLGVHVPAMTPTQGYVYARIGLKIANVEDLIFSPLIQVSL